MKIKTTYISNDGQEFRNKKAALARDAVLLVESLGCTEEAFSKMAEEMLEKDGRELRAVTAHRGEDWRNWYQGEKDEFIFKGVVEWYKNKDIVTLKITTPETDNESLQKKLHKDTLEAAIKEATEEAAEKGWVLNKKKEDKRVVELFFAEPEKTLLGKLREGIKLSSREIEDMLWENEEVYREEGEDGRWSRTITSVLKLEDESLWAVNWEFGLTELQENDFWEQPYEVTLEKKEVVVVETSIVPIKKER